jgi:phage terminase large subunit-like protein
LIDLLSGLPPRRALALVLQERARRKRENRLKDYQPYPKQLEFHAAGARYRERLLRAGNQVGKSWAAAFELAIHLTGRYPAWWPGRRWDRPISAWAASKSGVITRDGIQRLLLGRPGDWGTGSIPKETIAEPPRRSSGTPDLIDSLKVRHATGGLSHLVIKTYDQGRERWQAETLDIVAYDEEPDFELYMEGLTRTNATGGIVWLTFTPLLGMSETVRLFLTPGDDPGAAQRHDTNMTIYDAPHLDEKERAIIIARYPKHEREARTRGVPMLGSGLIFPVSEDAIAVKAFPLPDHWPRLCGLDFGWDHPTAGAWLAWDRDTDTVYTYDCYRVREQTPVVHGAAIKARGDWIPVAWPHDGLQHSKDSGEQLAEQYRKLGVNMLPDYAQYPETHGEGDTKQSRVSVEAGLMDMLDRMQTGRFKVFDHLNDWFEEFRLYHREDGKVIAEHEDLMCGTRYAVMMLRFAATPSPEMRIDHNRRANWRLG